MKQIFYNENFRDIASAPLDGTMVWLSNSAMRNTKMNPVKARFNGEYWIGHITDYLVVPDKWHPIEETVGRAWTSEELCDNFVKHLMVAAKYWAMQPDMTTLERTEGLVHSVLATIDGCTLNFPSLNLVPAPHESDKEYLLSEGENYFEEVPFNENTPLRYLMSKHPNI